MLSADGVGSAEIDPTKRRQVRAILSTGKKL
jgi:hypothetical protein